GSWPEGADGAAGVPAVRGGLGGVASVDRQLARLDGLDQGWLPRIGLGGDDVDAGGAQPGHDEIPALGVVVMPVVMPVRLVAEAGAAGVPSEMMELVPGVGHVQAPDDLAVAGRLRVGVDHDEGVGLGRLSRTRGVERGNVGQTLGLRRDRGPRRPVEGWISHRTAPFTYINYTNVENRL